MLHSDKISFVNSCRSGDLLIRNHEIASQLSSIIKDHGYAFVFRKMGDEPFQRKMELFHSRVEGDGMKNLSKTFENVGDHLTESHLLQKVEERLDSIRRVSDIDDE